jgi:MOSC domain-containing protein YiiM
MRQPSLALHNIYISEGHQFFGRHGLGALSHPILELDEVECVAGQGLRGDRFFASAKHPLGQVTLFSREVFLAMQRDLGVTGAQPSALRRNLIVSGADLNTLIGLAFQLQGIQLRGVEECRPCYWMDLAVGPGAEAWLRGRGGLRCRILTSGWLRVERDLTPRAELQPAQVGGRRGVNTLRPVPG